MKTITTLLIAFSLSIFNAFAQTINVQAGFSHTSAKYTYKDRNYFEGPVFNPGLQIGVMSEFQLKSNISLISGVLFQTKGFHFSENMFPDFDWKRDQSYNIWYFDIPVLFHVKIPIAKFGFFVDAGPYAGIGLSGNYEYKAIFSDGIPIVEKGKFVWDSEKGETEELKRLEYGIMSRVGVKFRQLEVGLSYELSLRNITVYNNYDYKNRVLTFFVSYQIWNRNNE